jgi:hypothetical protein
VAKIKIIFVIINKKRKNRSISLLLSKKGAVSKVKPAADVTWRRGTKKR